MSAQNPFFLYVEDDPLSRRVIEVMIKQVLGYPQVVIFENSVDFQNRLTSLPGTPDVIFLDVQVAPHDGYAMLRMLRENPQYQDTTVIAMTANVMSHDVTELRRAGFSGLIGKPIMKDVFPELVTRILSGEAVWYVPA